MDKEHKPTKLGDVYKLLLNSSGATQVGDNSFNFKVNFADITGDVVRCVVRSGIIPPPATYISRRLWLTNNNTFVNAHTDTLPPVGQRVNDFNTLFAKYGTFNWIYLYYPKKSMYVRLYYNNIFSDILRQTRYSTSSDGVNWTAESNILGIGLVQDIDWSASAEIPFDCYEIDTAINPRGCYIQNIHCPNLAAMRSYSTATQTPTDIIGHVNQVSGTANPYILYDMYYHPFQSDLNNEVMGNTLRATRSLNIYFSRVATPTVKEPVLMPWSLELNFYTDKQ